MSISQQIKGLPEAHQNTLADIRAKLQGFTQPTQGQAPLAGNDNRTSNAAMLQKATMQMNTKPAMSPTDAYAGRTALQGPAQGVEVKGPEKSLQTPSVPPPSRGQSRGR